jgi:hypothetical protein
VVPLFKKNAFSVKTPRFLQTPRKVAEEIASVLGKCYPRIEPVNILAVTAFGVNSRNWKIETPRGSHILKKAESRKGIMLNRQAEWATSLRRSGFPAPEFTLGKNGLFVSRFGSSAYCLSRFETGNYFGSRPEEWGELVCHHRRLVDFSVANSEKLKRHRFAARDFFTTQDTHTIKRLANGAAIPGLTRRQVDYIRLLHEKLSREYRKKRMGMRRTIYHIDVHPHNLIFRAGRLKLLVDLESFQWTWLEISLGFSLYKCARELIVAEPAASRPSAKLVGLLRKDFERRFPEHSFSELLLLGQMDVLKRFLWIIHDLLNHGSSRWHFMLATQYAGLREIDAIREIMNGKD